MARITCAISGIRFSTSYLEDVSIPHTAGYFHPIFALSHRSLYSLYSKHCKGELSATDSYLLFLSFLNGSGQIEWQHPVTVSPSDSATKRLIANNFSQLVTVLEKTGLIQIPSFRQPSFKVTHLNSYLEEIPFWIKAWEDNIDTFHRGIADTKMIESLQEVENRLGRLILSGEKPEKYSHVIANWANQAAIFPPLKAELYSHTIRSCFNITKMFNTPLPLLKEIKDYCECNIEAGSIHFHTLMHVLKEGISRHVDYLGGSSLALGYTLLESPVPQAGSVAARENESKNDAELLVLASSAPSAPPKQEDYPDSLSFLRAKLAYRVAAQLVRATAAQKPEPSQESTNETEDL